MDEEILKIQQKIEQGLFQQALLLIQQELQAPYIPTQLHQQLLELEAICKEQLPAKPSSLSFEDVYQALLDSKQLELLLALESFNLALYPTQLQTLLDTLAEPMAQGLLIEVMIKQRLVDTFTLKRQGLGIEFTPMSVVSIENQDGIVHANQCINEWFLQDPSMGRLSQDTLMKVALANLPLSFEVEEGEWLAHSVVRYVYHALGQPESWHQHSKTYGVNKEACLEITV